MLRFPFKKTLRNVIELKGNHYCQKTFSELPKTIPVETKPTELASKRKISKNLILQLEVISLVNFGNDVGVKIVEDAISYADKLDEVNTDGVEPLYTVLEKESLYLRVDFVKADIKKSDLLSHSENIFEDYYTAAVRNTSCNSGAKKNIRKEKISSVNIK